MFKGLIVHCWRWIMSAGEGFDRPLAGELLAVAEAAVARMHADAAEDMVAGSVAAEELLAAATSALGANYSLAEIAEAEACGKGKVRRELAGDALRRVERSGRHSREAEAEHHRAIARAMRLGLSMREIALAAGVTHGTIRAISHRVRNAGAPAHSRADRPQATRSGLAFEDSDPKYEATAAVGAPPEA
jgi:DNA-directed RNA polymerase specialized sigma24 family protein